MILCLDSGDLYCTRCGRLCDNACYTDCIFYYGQCTSCKHFDDESGYCDDCYIGGESKKWEDKYIHGGVYK